MNQKLLTGLELKVMNLLWAKEKAHVKDIIEIWDEVLVPAYNTVSTVVRILEEKGFVGHEALGRSHKYFPLLTKADYQKRLMKNVLESVFSGSVTSLVSTLVDDKKLSGTEIDEIKKMIDQHE